MSPNHLTTRALILLIGVAFVFGANHVAARVAFDHGLDVATAVAVRSLGTAAVVAHCAAAGVDVVRVHDGKPMVQAVRMADAIWRVPI